MKANPQKPLEARTEIKPFVPDMSDDELRKLAREKLSAILQGMDHNTTPSLLLNVVREVMDRIEGKPMQRQQSMVAIGNINDDTDNSPLPATDSWIAELIS